MTDSLVKKLEDLERMEQTYRGLIEHTRHMLKAHLDVCHVYKGTYDVHSCRQNQLQNET